MLDTRICPQPNLISVVMLVPYMYSLKLAHRIAPAHIGQASAVVYKLRLRNATTASAGLNPNGEACKISEQLFMVAISPCRVGFPRADAEFIPMHIRSPSEEGSVWFTITEAKAEKGHGDGESSARAAVAQRIQCARVG